jgi:heme-degrading monooxygenase HmoA
MYALMRTIRVLPGEKETFIHCWQNSELQQLKQQPGHQQTFLLKTSGSDEVIIFNLWKSKADSDCWGCSIPYWNAYVELENYWLKPPCLAEYTIVQAETTQE